MTFDKHRLKVLISNDDGLFSEGLTELANILAPWCDVTVVVPAGPQSAASHAITLHRPLRLYKVDEIAPDVTTYVVTGSPTDSVVLALDFVMKSDPPDLVLSGINKGGNTAEDVSYSGTVAAAMEGALCRIPSIAISLEGKKRTHYHVAALAALALVCRISRAMGCPISRKAEEIVPSHLRLECNGEVIGWKFILLNMNVPDMPDGGIKGWQATSLGRRDYKDIIIPRNDPRGEPYYWIAGEEVVADDPPGSDIRAVHDGYISLTPLLLDYTDYSKLESLNQCLGIEAKNVSDKYRSAYNDRDSFSQAEPISLRVGGLTQEELNLVLKNIPADLTFVNADDKIVFYAEKDAYLFPRKPEIIATDIRDCHSEKSMAELEEMLTLFKSGERRMAQKWSRRDGRLIRTRYIAVYDEDGAYQGILEVAEDATEANELKEITDLMEWV